MKRNLLPIALSVTLLLLFLVVCGYSSTSIDSNEDQNSTTDETLVNSTSESSDTPSDDKVTYELPEISGEEFFATINECYLNYIANHKSNEIQPSDLVVNTEAPEIIGVWREEPRTAGDRFDDYIMFLENGVYFQFPDGVNYCLEIGSYTASYNDSGIELSLTYNGNVLYTNSGIDWSMVETDTDTAIASMPDNNTLTIPSFIPGSEKNYTYVRIDTPPQLKDADSVILYVKKTTHTN